MYQIVERTRVGRECRVGGRRGKVEWRKLWEREGKEMGMEVRKAKGEMGLGKMNVWLKE